MSETVEVETDWDGMLKPTKPQITPNINNISLSVSENSTPLPKSDIPQTETPIQSNYLRLDISSLEETNLISEYIRFASGKSDAYPEYHHAAILTILSVIADRSVYIKLNQITHYTNMWCMCLGLSGISRKSTAIDEVDTILFKHMTLKNKLPDSFSTESLIQSLAKNSRRYLVVSECGRILQNVNKKTYLTDLRDFLCEIYDGKSHTRELTRKGKNHEIEDKHEIIDPYVSLLFATTPKNFQDNVSLLDLTSGWLTRFIYYAPNYPKRTLSLEQDLNNRFEKDLEHIVLRLQNINEMCRHVKRVRMIFSQRSMDMYNQWQISCEERQLNNGLENEASVFARLTPAVFKLSMLYALGSMEFHHAVIDYLSTVRISTTPSEKEIEGDFSIPEGLLETTTPEEYFDIESIIEPEEEPPELKTSTTQSDIDKFQKSKRKQKQKPEPIEPEPALPYTPEPEPDSAANMIIHPGTYGTPFDFYVDDKYIETAIRQVNDYFLPTAIRVLKEVEQGNEVNIQNKILNILEKNGGYIELRKIMKNLHIKRKDLDEHLKSLIDSGEIIQAPYFDGNHTATMIFITSMYESMKNTSTN